MTHEHIGTWTGPGILALVNGEWRHYLVKDAPRDLRERATAMVGSDRPQITVSLATDPPGGETGMKGETMDFESRLQDLGRQVQRADGFEGAYQAMLEAVRDAMDLGSLGPSGNFGADGEAEVLARGAGDLPADVG